VATVEVRALAPADDRTKFHSGNPDLDRFFIGYAGQNQFKHHVGTTYVAVEDSRILGFATVSASHIETPKLPQVARRKLPRCPLSVLRLARLAVDDAARGRGVGEMLLRSVFVLAEGMATRVGCVSVLVDAKPEAVSFFERYGFIRLEALQGQLGDRPEPLPMFLSLGRIPK
jgi:GNAT superfamily N-acetyltransferase